MTISLHDFCTAQSGDGYHDDTTAFRDAFFRLYKDKGGHLIIPPTRLDGTPALWRFRGPYPCELDFGSGWSDSSVLVSGYGARILATTEQRPYTPLVFPNIDFLTIEGVTFYGWYLGIQDIPPNYPLAMKNIIDASGVTRVKDLKLCGFTAHDKLPDGSGGFTPVPRPGFITASNLFVENCSINGCGGTAPGIGMKDASLLYIQDFVMADFFPQSDNKPHAPCGQLTESIRFEQSSDSRDSVYGSSTVSIRQMRVDEGCGVIKIGKAGGTPLCAVSIEGLRQNVMPWDGANGVELTNVLHASLKYLWAREGNAKGTASIVKTRDVGSLVIEGTSTSLASAPLDHVDIQADRVWIRGSHFDRAGINTPHLVDDDA